MKTIQSKKASFDGYFHLQKYLIQDLRPDFLDDPFLSGLLRVGEEELDDLESRRSRRLILIAFEMKFK